MSVTNPGGSGASGVVSGLAAARPAAAAASGQIYWATDTNEITFSTGVAWTTLQRVASDGSNFRVGKSNGGSLLIGDSGSVGFRQNGAQLQVNGGPPIIQNATAGAEAAAATAGANGAPPAQVAGYFIFASIITGGNVKVPYYGV